MAISARIDELRKKFDDNPRRYFAPLANEYRKAGDPGQAIFICEAYLPQQPGHMSGHIVFGQALYELGRNDEARAVFETALSLDPENLIALRHLGDIARLTGDTNAARNWYQRVLEADPRNDEIAQIVASLTPPVEEPPPADASASTSGADTVAVPAVVMPRWADPDASLTDVSSGGGDSDQGAASHVIVPPIETAPAQPALSATPPAPVPAHPLFDLDELMLGDAQISRTTPGAEEPPPLPVSGISDTSDTPQPSAQPIELDVGSVDLTQDDALFEADPFAIAARPVEPDVQPEPVADIAMEPFVEMPVTSNVSRDAITVETPAVAFPAIEPPPVPNLPTDFAPAEASAEPVAEPESIRPEPLIPEPAVFDDQSIDLPSRPTTPVYAETVNALAPEPDVPKASALEIESFHAQFDEPAPIEASAAAPVSDAPVAEAPAVEDQVPFESVEDSFSQHWPVVDTLVEAAAPAEGPVAQAPVDDLHTRETPRAGIDIGSLAIPDQVSAIADAPPSVGEEAPAAVGDTPSSADEAQASADEAVHADSAFAEPQFPPPLPEPVFDVIPETPPLAGPVAKPVAEMPPPVPAEAFVTETMAELYLQQGHLDSALDIYRKLVEQRPGDSQLQDRLAAIERRIYGTPPRVEAPAVIEAPAAEPEPIPGPTIRDFLAGFAARKPATPIDVEAVERDAAARSDGYESVASIEASAVEAAAPPEEIAAGEATGAADAEEDQAAETAQTVDGAESSVPVAMNRWSGETAAVDEAAPSESFYAEQIVVSESAEAIEAIEAVEVVDVATSDDAGETTPATERATAGSIEALFGNAESSAFDTAAANALAEGFAPIAGYEEARVAEAVQPGEPAEPIQSIEPPVATAPPTVDTATVGTPVGSEGGDDGFSFDQFFAVDVQDATPIAARETEPLPGDAADVAQFNHWLTGLKKT